MDEWELQEAQMGSETVQEDSCEGSGRAKAVVRGQLFLLPSPHYAGQVWRVLHLSQGSQAESQRHMCMGREAREAAVAFWVHAAPAWYSLGVTGCVTGCSL